MKKLIFLYLVLKMIIIFCFMVMYSCSSLILYDEKKILNSPYISQDLKTFNLIFLNFILNFCTVITRGFFLSFSAYFCYVCYCIKLFSLEFVSQLKVLIRQQDYQNIFRMYEAILETMSFAENFLSFPIFLRVLTNMVGLFWLGYSFAFIPNKDYPTYAFTVLGMFQNFMHLLIILFSASTVNEIVATVRRSILSLPAFFPRHYQQLKMQVEQRFNRKVSLTLWKIYRIDRSVFISVVGTLLTYGFLLGTQVSVQTSNESSFTICNCSS